MQDFLPAHEATANALAIEARAQLAKCLRLLAEEVIASAERIAAGDSHGLRSPAREDRFLALMRGSLCVPSDLIAMLDRAEAAIDAYGPEGKSYYAAPHTVRAIPIEHSVTMRVMMGRYNDAAVAPNDPVSWDGDEAGVFFSGRVLGTDRNFAAIKDVVRHVRYDRRSVDGLSVVELSKLRPFNDD